MLFMIIETFADTDMIPIYRRLRDVGRGLPEGLRCVESWVEPNFARCFQLMECDDLRLIERWALHWRGLGAHFETFCHSHASGASRPTMRPTSSSPCAWVCRWRRRIRRSPVRPRRSASRCLPFDGESAAPFGITSASIESHRPRAALIAGS